VLRLVLTRHREFARPITPSGVTFEYQRFALGTVRNENPYHFAFSLSNVGTFGTIKRLQRLF
jgi:hypothetical protein